MKLESLPIKLSLKILFRDQNKNVEILFIK